MVINHRYALRVSTDLALSLFLIFAAGAGLWTIDEFLNWNVLPDWIDNYARLIVVFFGMAAGLAIATSLLCSVALIGEAAAERAGIADYRTSARAWRYAALVLAAFGGVIVIFYKVDAYRKRLEIARHHASQLEIYQRQVRDLQEAAANLPALFSESMLRSLGTGEVVAADEELVRLLSAIQASVPHQPSVSLLIRARAPYQYAHLQLTARSDRDREESRVRHALNVQFYVGFPAAEESRTIDELFAGRVARIEAPLEGQILNNVMASSWQTLSHEGRVVGLVILKAGRYPPPGIHHFGPAAAPDELSPAQGNSFPDRNR